MIPSKKKILVVHTDSDRCAELSRRARGAFLGYQILEATTYCDASATMDENPHVVGIVAAENIAEWPSTLLDGKQLYGGKLRQFHPDIPMILVAAGDPVHSRHFHSARNERIPLLNGTDESALQEAFAGMFRNLEQIGRTRSLMTVVKPN